MELKIQCDCGQKFKFDVEPINGQMPFTVTCPLCGLDGTRNANAVLHQLATAPAVPAISQVPTPALAVSPAALSLAPAPILLSATLIAPSPAPAVAAPQPPRSAVAPPPALAPAAPVAVAPAVITPPAVARDSSEKPRLRINKAAHTETPVAAAVESVSVQAPAPRRPVPGTRLAPAADTAERKGSFAMGLVGALLGALIGSAIYFAVFSYADKRIKLLAIAVGFLGGLGARLLGKVGSNELGVITATLSLLGIFLAQYAVTWRWWHLTGEAEAARFSYEARVEEARKVIASIPNGSDQEIRLHIAKEWAEEFEEKVDLTDIDVEDIQEFRDKELPVMRDLASGETTKEEFEQSIKAEREEAQEAEEESEGTFKWYFMLMMLNKVNLVSMAAAAGLAYKMSTDA
jgi:hypothetical protein